MVLPLLRSSRERHDYDDCPDPDCPRFPCRVYREGYERGYWRGFADGEATGFAAGAATGSG